VKFASLLVGGQNLQRAVFFFTAHYKTGIAGVSDNSGQQIALPLCLKAARSLSTSITFARFKIGHTPRKFPDSWSATSRIIACITPYLHSVP